MLVLCRLEQGSFLVLRKGGVRGRILSILSVYKAEYNEIARTFAEVCKLKPLRINKGINGTVH